MAIKQEKGQKMVETVISETCTCDICKKQIYVFQLDMKKRIYTDGVKHFSVVTGHNDWGNDSCDSIEVYDYCSGSCLSIAFGQYLERTKKQNTEYFEVNRKK